MMKMILAIINQDDARSVIKDLNKGGFSVTKLATTGGFLQAGNVTILVGVDEARLEEALECIHKNAHSRKQIIPSSSTIGGSGYASMPIEVSIGGATVFVLDIERHEKF